MLLKCLDFLVGSKYTLDANASCSKHVLTFSFTHHKLVNSACHLQICQVLCHQTAKL